MRFTSNQKSRPGRDKTHSKIKSHGYSKSMSIKSDTKLDFRELDKRKTRENCIKIIEQAERDEAAYADCFTAAVSGDTMSDIYKVHIRLGIKPSFSFLDT